ncbi:FAD-binding protein [Candidatus Woesearchaeota archaeon]|nr:FAD-binding protein [Candidatus Woesearchaeota archaeon]
MCKNASRSIRERESWGMRFHKEVDGRLIQRFFGAHRYRRTCFYGDQTGKKIIRILANEVDKRKVKLTRLFVCTKSFKL